MISVLLLRVRPLRRFGERISTTSHPDRITQNCRLALAHGLLHIGCLAGTIKTEEKYEPGYTFEDNYL